MIRSKNVLTFIKRHKAREESRDDEALAPGFLHRPSEQDRLLIEQANIELANLGLYIVLTTSALNYLDSRSEWKAEHAHFRFEPSEPVIIRAAVEMLMWTDRMPEIHLHSDLMIARLWQAKRLLRSLKERRTTVPTLRERDELVSAWTITSDAALLTIDDFERANDLYDVSASPEQSPERQELRSLLIAVRDGGIPLLIDGLPQLPDWAERRRSRRIPLNMDGKLRYRGQSRSVRVRDVSAGGMGVEFCGALDVGEIVMLTLESGRRFLATIAWCHTDRAGLTLANRLEPCDPMISAT